MFKLLECLLFCCVFSYAVSEVDIGFANITQLMQFLDEWSKSESAEDVKEKHDWFLMRMMNTSMDPCDDFYNFACGNIESVTPTERAYGGSVLKWQYLFLEYIQKKLCESDIYENDSETSAKVKIFYQSCVDNSTFHIEELASFIKNFATWPILQERESEDPDGFDWLNVTALSAQYGTFALFSHRVSVSNNIYYDRFQGIEETKLNITKVKNIAEDLSINLSEKEVELEEVDKFITRMYKISVDNSPVGGAFFYDQSDLQETIPEIDLRRYLQILSDGKRGSPSEKIILQVPTWFQDLSALIHETDHRTIANYVFVRWLYVAGNLTDLHSKENPREKCRLLVGKLLKPAFVGLFSETYFDEEAYSKTKHLVDDIHIAAIDVVNETQWFTEETKLKALEKISIVKKNVGIPSYMRPSASLNNEYKDLQLDRNSFVKNYFSATRTNTLMQEKRVSRISEEFMTDPLELGAFFRVSSKGLLEVTAGMLQPPLYHKSSPYYVKYGAIGVGVGHEFMHAFDVDGILYDEKGGKGVWWDPKISSTYYTRAGCYYSQYDHYKLNQINQTVNTERTIAENIADNQGLKVALNAYKSFLMNNNETSSIVYKGEILSPLQAFFLSFAHHFCGKHTEFELDWTIANDEHAPDIFRILGPLSNSAEFAEAFSCPVGSPMNPEKKCNYLNE